MNTNSASKAALPSAHALSGRLKNLLLKICPMHVLEHEFEITISELSNKNDPKKYTEALKKICTLKTAEELSYILHHIKPFPSLPAFNLNLFRKGVSASWEHPENIDGCSWITQFKSEVSNILLERIAAYFCLVGYRKFKCNGIKINIRKSYVKFEIWSANVPTVVESADVMAELQESLGLDFNIDFTYKNHKELLERAIATPKEVF